MGCPFHASGGKVEGAEFHVNEMGMHHLTPIDSYDNVLAEMIADPYDYNNLPTIPIVNFNFRTGEYEVGIRSRDILKERHIVREVRKRKPIHPMGIPVEGKMVFYKNDKYSGVFKGGTFPIQSRFSISQGNPLRFEKRTGRQIRRGLPAKPQVRSVTMGILLFDPNVPKDEKSPVVSMVLQNDLNGKINAETGEADYFLEEPLFNKPVFDPKLLLPPTGKLYHWGTLSGVFFGALQNQFEKTDADGQGVESTTLGVDPLLRPVHGLANFGETDPSKIKPPVWVKFVPREDNPAIVRMDDFRKEIYESISQNGARTWDIYVSDTVNMNTGEVLWEKAGYFEVDTVHLPSDGSDRGITVPHADTTNINYATGKSIYDYINAVDSEEEVQQILRSLEQN